MTVLFIVAFENNTNVNCGNSKKVHFYNSFVGVRLFRTGWWKQQMIADLVVNQTLELLLKQHLAVESRAQLSVRLSWPVFITSKVNTWTPEVAEAAVLICMLRVYTEYAEVEGE